MTGQQIVVTALLGRRDKPTDAVRDYCKYLARTLARRDVDVDLAEVAWDREGWRHALRRLWRASREWRGRWVLVQYTALAWSRHGFPFGVLAVFWLLRRRRARCAVVFHDVNTYPGTRLIDRVRRACQRWIMLRAFDASARCIFTVRPEAIHWVPANTGKIHFAPVGANIPEPDAAADRPRELEKSPGTVAVFGVTGGAAMSREVEEIAYAMKRVGEHVVNPHLVVLGRGSEVAGESIRKALDGSGVEVTIFGLLPPEEIARALSKADAMLFVRGNLSSRRGSAMAGIACGLPIVAYSGPETVFPVTEAGVEAVEYGDRDSLAAALLRVLTDRAFRQQLRRQNREAQAQYFSWNKIAEQYIRALELLGRKYRLLCVATHPVQYQSPVFRQMAQHPKLEIQVAYCSLQGAEPGLDRDFGVEFAWDVPLLDGYPWTRVPNRSPRPGLKGFFGLMNTGLWKMVSRGGFDAVVTYTGYAKASFWIVAAAAKLHRIPFIFGTDATSLEPRDGRRWKAGVKKLFLPAVFRLATTVIIPSEAGREFILRLGISESRIFLTPYTVDNNWWVNQAARVDRTAVRVRWGIPESASVVLFCAKLQPWKRPQDLLHAFAQANVENSYLVFAGDGSLRAQLGAEANALQISGRVRFLGFVNQSAMPAVYRGADLLVLPSEYEPFGVVTNEAMLCGCPPAVSDRVGAGFDLVKHGETGYVFPCGDVEALRKILSEALQDCRSLRAMSRAAAERMKTWTPRRNAEALAAAVEAACDQGR